MNIDCIKVSKISILLFTLLITLPSTTFAQKDTLSKIEKFVSETPGSMIRREYKEIGKIKSLTVGHYKLTNLRSNKSMYYVAIVNASVIASYQGVVVIDMDDLPGIIDGINFLIKTSAKAEPESREEYSYTTESNLKLHLTDNLMSKGWIMGIGHQYYYASSFKLNQHISLKPSIFEEIVPFLKQALDSPY